MKGSATPAPLNKFSSDFLSKKQTLNQKSALGYIKGVHFDKYEKDQP
jgi:hypothetical protein